MWAQETRRYLYIYYISYIYIYNIHIHIYPRHTKCSNLVEVRWV